MYETQKAIKGLSPNPSKVSGQDASTRKLYQTFKRNMMIMLFKLFQGKTTKGTFPSSFYVVSIMLTPKADKEWAKKFPNHRSISLTNVNIKISHKIPVSGIQQYTVTKG